MTDKQINPNLRKLAELTHNPRLNVDETIFEKETEIPSASAPELKSFIYVPSIGLYVTDKRILCDYIWNKAQEELKKQKLAMPTPYQFKEFLKYLRDSKEQKHQKIFNEITEIRDPCRGNWLNAKFEKRKNKLYMISENVLENGDYKTIEQKLEDFLDEDRTPGISLDDWLDSDAKHGLPQPKIDNWLSSEYSEDFEDLLRQKLNSRDLWYYFPRENYVMWFDAHIRGLDLYCCGVPDGSGSSLGVFACAEGKVTKKE